MGLVWSGFSRENGRGVQTGEGQQTHKVTVIPCSPLPHAPSATAPPPPAGASVPPRDGALESSSSPCHWKWKYFRQISLKRGRKEGMMSTAPGTEVSWSVFKPPGPVAHFHWISQLCLGLPRESRRGGVGWGMGSSQNSRLLGLSGSPKRAAATSVF